MYDYILSHPKLTISAKPLARKISEIVGKEIKVHIDPLKVKPDARLIIRYGNSAIVPGDNGTLLNNAEWIRLAGNKVKLSELLKGYNEDRFVPHLELIRGVLPNFPADYPVVIRHEINRGGGIGIEFKEDNVNFPFNSYWSRYYPFEFELGVHILGGEIVRVFKKVREDGLEPEKFPRRNTNNGYKFVLRPRWNDVYRGLGEFVKKLYDIVPIQFARLDVGYHKQTGGYRLIEINSAPDLSQNKNTLELYAKFLAERIYGIK